MKRNRCSWVFLRRRKKWKEKKDFFEFYLRKEREGLGRERQDLFFQFYFHSFFGWLRGKERGMRKVKKVPILFLGARVLWSLQDKHQIIYTYGDFKLVLLNLLFRRTKSWFYGGEKNEYYTRTWFSLWCLWKKMIVFLISMESPTFSWVMMETRKHISYYMVYWLEKLVLVLPLQRWQIWDVFQLWNLLNWIWEIGSMMIFECFFDVFHWKRRIHKNYKWFYSWSFPRGHDKSKMTIILEFEHFFGNATL